MPMHQGWAILKFWHYNYCKAYITIIMIIVLSVFTLKLFTNASICPYLYLNIAKLVMKRTNYHDISQLLLLTIIVRNKNYIIIKEIS